MNGLKVSKFVTTQLEKKGDRFFSDPKNPPQECDLEMWQDNMRGHILRATQSCGKSQKNTNFNCTQYRPVFWAPFVDTQLTLDSQPFNAFSQRIPVGGYCSCIFD